METPYSGFDYWLLLSTLNFIIKPISFSVVVALISMLVLLFVTALVSAAEAAFFSLSPSDIQNLNDSETKTDKLILGLIDKPKRILATLLISLNFVNIAIVILSTFITVSVVDFSENPILGFIIQVVAVTFLILITGEIVPKIYATQFSLKTTRLLVYPVYFLEKVFYPVSSFLIFSTSIIDKRVKQKGHYISVDELSHALELTSDNQMPQDDHKILKGIVKFGNIDVKQIMKSRMDVVAFEYHISYTELLEKILNSGFSRIPVYRETFDNISGVLYIKDLLPHLDKGNDFQWQTFIRTPFFVPENKKIDDLLKEFQHKKIHLAIVVDEFGGTSGIVTLEDVIEEIVGEINDEFDDDDLVYSKLDEENYVFEGKISLNDLYRILEIEGKPFEAVKGDADTLAGFLIEKEGRIPKKNENIQFGDLIFHIESADNRKVKRVKITLQKKNVE